LRNKWAADISGAFRSHRSREETLRQELPAQLYDMLVRAGIDLRDHPAVAEVRRREQRFAKIDLIGRLRYLGVRRIFAAVAGKEE
jgi:hypothetical protein